MNRTDVGLAVFLRAVNVGGHGALKPKALADSLDLVNIGAAGTFVAPDATDAKKLERAIAKAMPFETDVFVCDGSEITKLVGKGFDGPRDVKRYVTVLEKAARLKVPLEKPEGSKWEVRVISVSGRFALSWHRRQGDRLNVYPNAVLEKATGLAATTRNWDTFVKVTSALEK